VLPLPPLRDETFAVTAVIGFAVGFALFGSVTYAPVFLQVVQSMSPTRSGLVLVPMMAGMVGASVISGQMISRTGRYKMIRVVGNGVRHHRIVHPVAARDDHADRGRAARDDAARRGSGWSCRCS
jgi:hypothetical protein